MDLFFVSSTLRVSSQLILNRKRRAFKRIHISPQRVPEMHWVYEEKTVYA